MLLFSINRSRGYENPSLDIIVIELCSTGGFPLKEAHEHCFHIQSVISVVILISFQCYCGECSSYIVVILPLLAFYFCSAYILYMVYYIILPENISKLIPLSIKQTWVHYPNLGSPTSHGHNSLNVRSYVTFHIPPEMA
jgi:hypothetical protein